MKLTIIRHGEPDNPNQTLTSQGFLEVDALNEFLKDYKFDEAYSSPLPRAIITAEHALKGHNMDIKILPWLEEFIHLIKVPYCEEEVINWDFLPSYFTKQEEFYHIDKYLDHPVLASGNVKTYYLDVVNKLDELLANLGYCRNNRSYKVKESNRKEIVIFCHFGMMCVIMSHLLNIPYVQLAQSFICRPSGITTLVTEEREDGIAQFRCLGFGEIPHLNMKQISPSFHGRFCETFDSDERH